MIPETPPPLAISWFMCSKLSTYCFSPKIFLDGPSRMAKRFFHGETLVPIL